MSTEGDKRRTAFLRFKVLAGVLGVLSIVILACAGLGIKHHDADTFGPPYYVGGFIVGPVALLTAFVCMSVFIGAMGKSYDDDKMKRLAPQISCQYTMSMLLLPACFIGGVLTGIWGLDAEDINRTLAAIILAGCILTCFVTIVSMCTVCAYGKHFGVHINRRGRRTVIITDNSTAFSRSSEGTHDRSGGMVLHSNVNVFTTDTNHQHISQLEQQNQLLQQRLALQQQMLMQQQQQEQQQQFSGGVYPPPPAYEDPTYPPNTSLPGPSAPPPPYSKVV
ncbi:uncharacterized protein LOC123549960 [Mercenaria mercenaria]|uniref:uncharacterized protein LOC123549960 n=1 Tax=Mercenaria mercenaria TaxID=6596 RepID=UPI00234F8CC1|nr:uncharacterized protein LOC123549960 [Mercenaria mercenaria]